MFALVILCMSLSLFISLDTCLSPSVHSCHLLYDTVIFYRLIYPFMSLSCHQLYVAVILCTLFSYHIVYTISFSVRFLYLLNVIFIQSTLFLPLFVPFIFCSIFKFIPCTLMSFSPYVPLIPVHVPHVSIVDLQV